MQSDYIRKIIREYIMDRKALIYYARNSHYALHKKLLLYLK